MERIAADLVGAARADRGRDPPPGRRRRHRRDERRDRGLVGPPGERARRLRRGDRHAQGDGAAVEEGDLRRRRGMDRAGLVSEPGIVSTEFPEEQPRAARRRGAAGIGPHPGPAARRRRRAPQGRRLAQVPRHLRRRRRLRAHLGLALRGRIRAPHPRARARSLRRGAAAGAQPAASGLHPLPRRVRRAAQPAVRPVAERARLGGRPGRRRDRRARLPRLRQRDRLRPAARARLRRLLPQPVQPVPIGFLDGGHILRAWRVLRAGGGRSNPAEARRLAGVVGAYSIALAAALAIGMVASHVPQNRL